LDERLFQAYLREPGLFANELRTLPRGATVVVDEIQRLPSLLNEVHRFIEDQRMRFVLLGSSARKLKQAGTNLLAGKALHRQMFPLLPQELGRDFNLAEVLRHGSLPVIWAAPDRREALESYVQMYLKEEIQAGRKRCQPPKIEKLASCPDLVAGTISIHFHPAFDAASHRLMA
jgi:predicted AAA+ superfamily ATPase